MFSQGAETNAAALGFVGMLALSAQRIMPLVQVIYAGKTAITGNSYAFRQINEKINLLESTKQTEISDKVESLELVDFKITNCSYVNSKHINFLVSLGETLVIQGESGVGKSSFLSLMLGKKFTYDGNILINHRVFDPTMFSLKNNIAYATQQVHIMRKSLLENITLTSDKSQIEPERLQLMLKYNWFGSVV